MSFIRRKVLDVLAAGTSLLTLAVLRRRHVAALAAATSAAEAMLVKIERPPPARGDMRVGQWTRPAFGTKLRVRPSLHATSHSPLTARTRRAESR